MEFVNRENQIVQTLNELAEEELDFVVVGGYAVTGLGRHRFSVDCDVVISKKDSGKIEGFLKKHGYESGFEKKVFDGVYAGEFVRYIKRVGSLPVSFDLLVGSLVCRNTGAAWSFEYIKEHSVETIIGGLEAVAKCRVPEKELMVAFKIHSARRTDVRDIIMLIDDLDLDKVLIHLRRGKVEVLEKQISGILEMLNDVKLVDSLKGVFFLSFNVRKQIVKTRMKMEILARALLT